MVSFLGLALKNQKGVYFTKDLCTNTKNELNLRKNKLVDKLIQSKKYLIKNQESINYLVHGEFFKSVLIESGIQSENISIVGLPRIKKIKLNKIFNPLSQALFTCVLHIHMKDLKKKQKLKSI